MVIHEVDNNKKQKKFIDFPRKVYHHDPAWICFMEDDVKAVFNPSKNSFFRHGDCKRWILEDSNGLVSGRIAAFIDHKKNAGNYLKTGGIGFFECTNNREAAFRLFDTAKDWLQRFGVSAMDGPINFGENDKYWGLLVQGFHSPTFGMNYNPPYYEGFFEAYGFHKFYDQYTNVLDATIDLPDRFNKIADWVTKKPFYSFSHFSFKKKEKFFADFLEIYNDAWSEFENFSPMDPENVRESFRQMKSIADEKIIWFAYHEDEPIAFILCLPDINQVFRYLNGKLNLTGKLKFFWYRKTTTINRIRIIVMGCKKKFQNHGVESALIRCLQKEVLPRKTIREVELAWVGDFNTKMLALHQAAGAVHSKTHRTYRYVFD